MVPRIPHIPNKNAGMNGLGQIALSAESCYHSITKLELYFRRKVSIIMIILSSH